MILIRKLRRAAFHLEAALLLVAAKIALRIVPFSRLARWFQQPMRAPERVGIERAQVIIAVRHAIFRGARYLPGDYVCFPRGIVAQVMLRRRGVATTLIYGAATLPGQGLTGHVWVMDGETGVIGAAKASEYRELARYGAP